MHVSPGRAAALALLALALASCAGPRPAERGAPAVPAAPVAITILSTNDFHGALEQMDSDRATKRPIGGAAFLTATIDRERATNPEGTLLLDAGDIYQGTALSNLTRGAATIDYMNAADFDAAAIGNHDFDWDVPVLLDRMEQAKFPLLVANMIENATGKPPKWARAHVIEKRHGVRIAVIGLITPDTPNVTMPEHVEPYTFLDPAPVANEWIAKLIPSEADIAVIVTHIGASMRDDGSISGEAVEMSRAIQGEAAIVAGHTHQVVEGMVEGVPIVEAGASGRHVGRIDLLVDRASRRVVESKVDVLTVFADSIAADAEVAALVERHRAAIAPQLDEVLGEAAVELETARRESSLGNLVTDVMRDAARASFAFQNPGGIRAPIDKGPITYSEIYRVMPFDNTIVVMELSGDEVVRLIEESAGDGSFLHASGLRYSLDMSRPAGGRITALADASGAVLRADTRYLVAINNFMAQGGDDLPTVTNHPGARETGIVIREALAERVRADTKAGRAVSARVEGRVFIEGRGQ